MAAYIAFEGGEGSGKSTQARILARRIDARLTFEPGASELGAELRRLVLGVGEAPVGPRAETLIMAADRAQHLADVVGPTLDAGRHVVSDRSAYSSLAYQGGARGLGVEAVRRVNDWAIAGRWPDRVVLLDADPAAAHKRLERSLDRLEQESVDFHATVRATYLDLAAAEPDRFVVLSAEGTIEEIAETVWDALTDLVAPTAEAGA